MLSKHTTTNSEIPPIRSNRVLETQAGTRHCSAISIAPLVAIMAISGLVLRAQPAYAEIQDCFGGGAGASSSLDPDSCGRNTRNIPGVGGDGSGSTSPTTNLYLLRTFHGAGTRHAVDFDTYDIRDNGNPQGGASHGVVAIEQLAENGGHLLAGFAPIPWQMRPWTSSSGVQVNLTYIGFFVHVPGADEVRHLSVHELIYDAGYTRLGMTLRLLASSACGVANLYKTVGCTPPSLHVWTNSPGVGWEFDYTMHYSWQASSGLDPFCSQNHSPFIAIQPFEKYSPIVSAGLGLMDILEWRDPITGDLRQCSTDRIHLHTLEHYWYYWSCQNCLDHCNPPPIVCPQGCEATSPYPNASDAMWCISDNNRIMWDQVTPHENAFADVYDPNLAHLTGSANDPTGNVFDICRGDVPYTPCRQLANPTPAPTPDWINNTLWNFAMRTGPITIYRDGDFAYKVYLDRGPCYPMGRSDLGCGPNPEQPHINVIIVPIGVNGKDSSDKEALMNFHITLLEDPQGGHCICVWESKSGRTMDDCSDSNHDDWDQELDDFISYVMDLTYDEGTITASQRTEMLGVVVFLVAVALALISSGGGTIVIPPMIPGYGMPPPAALRYPVAPTEIRRDVESLLPGHEAYNASFVIGLARSPHEDVHGEVRKTHLIDATSDVKLL